MHSTPDQHRMTSSMEWPDAVALISGFIFLLHAFLILWMLSPTLFGGEPPMWGDNGPNYYKASTSLRIVEEVGSTRGYDPQIFGGYPTGAVDTNSHGVHFLMRVLTPALSPERAFGLWLFAGLIFAPLGLAWLAALCLFELHGSVSQWWQLRWRCSLRLEYRHKK